jgi:hypothetical protein
MVVGDIGWAHLAYLSGPAGMDDIEAGLAGLPSHATMLEGFRKIAQGERQQSPALIWEGTNLLLRHEQFVTVQPNFEKLARDFDLTLSGLTTMNFDAGGLRIDRKRFTSFNVYMWTMGFWKLLLTRSIPNISIYDHRWLWVSSAVLPMWRKIETDPVVMRSIAMFIRTAEAAIEAIVVPAVAGDRP